MKTIKDYIQGERFTYGKKNCMVLEHMDDGTLCMVMDEDYTSEFGKSNNFAESTLREKLNTEYLNKWIDDGVFRGDFVKMTIDLTADDGLKDYGNCESYLAPRTCEQHRKYRYLIPKPTDYEWTATAYSTKSNGYSYNVRYVCASGALSGISAYGVGGVRPLFKLNPDTVIVPNTIIVTTATIPLKTAEPQTPSKAEPCEHEFEDLYYCSGDYQVIRTRNIWVSRSNGFKTKRLVFCKKCGQVFVKDF